MGGVACINKKLMFSMKNFLMKSATVSERYRLSDKYSSKSNLPNIHHIKVALHLLNSDNQ